MTPCGQCEAGNHDWCSSAVNDGHTCCCDRLRIEVKEET